VDESRPQWVGKSQDFADVKTFHFLRAFHCAGRCTDCGACERSCPVGINMRTLTKKLEKDCLELFDWEAGLSTDVRPPLDTYKPQDPNDFIK
jgi:ferredoxin